MPYGVGIVGVLLAEMIELGRIEFGSLSFMDGHGSPLPVARAF
jgi:hypothetical protein